MAPTSDPLRRARRDGVANRERLLYAYAELVTRDRSPRLEDVAERAGVARATAYRHFGDAEGLRIAAYLHASEDLRQAVREARGSSESLPVLLERIALRGLTVMDDLQLNAIPRPVGVRRLEQALAALLRALDELLAQRLGELDDVPPILLAEVFISLVEAVSRVPPPGGPERGARVAVRMFLSGVGPAS